MCGYYVVLRPWVPKVSFVSVSPFSTQNTYYIRRVELSLFPLKLCKTPVDFIGNRLKSAKEQLVIPLSLGCYLGR